MHTCAALQTRRQSATLYESLRSLQRHKRPYKRRKHSARLSVSHARKVACRRQCARYSDSQRRATHATEGLARVVNELRGEFRAGQQAGQVRLSLRRTKGHRQDHDCVRVAWRVAGDILLTECAGWRNHAATASVIFRCKRMAYRI